MMDLRRLHEEGKLGPVADFFFSPTKPTEELYDTWSDPHEISNLAADPGHASILRRMRNAHKDWVKETRDTGLIPEPVLVEKEQVAGNRYEILAGADDGFSNDLAEIAFLASEGTSALPQLVQALAHRESAVRYWGATGLGNIGPDASSEAGAVRALLEDESSVVRTAAARALCRMQMPGDALPVLVNVLKNGEQWERLHAAIVLDEIDEMARPVTPAMHEALAPRNDLYANGKYVVRVINRALNQLEGTNRTVE